MSTLLGPVAGCESHAQVNRYTSDSIPARHTGLLVRRSDEPQVRARLAAGDPTLTKAREQVRTLAEEAMKVPVRPITAGKDENPDRIAPSGDPHDYVSLSPYWWPDPNTKTGKPYIRRDGEINPERYEYDTPKLGDMGTAARELAWGYYATGDEKYAERAAEHLRAWFVDPETRMNPNMRYAQFVPGVSIGRSYGIIDTNRIRWVPDAALILLESDAWSEEDHRALQQWFSEYVDWLLTSSLGQAERKGENNHGSWYAAQVALYSLFAGREDVTREMVESIYPRIDNQIEPDGSQPHELERTRALDYVEFNTRALMDLARYGELIGVDLLNHEAEDGGSIRKAIDFGMPYWTGEKEWTYQQISEPKQHNYFQTLRRAARMYDEPAYERAAQKAKPDDHGDVYWIEILLPAHHDIGE